MCTTNEEMLVLEEGIEAGVVRACCTSGSAKV